MAAAPGGNRVSAGGQVADFVAAFGVRAHRAAIDARVERGDCDERSPERAAGVGRAHSPRIIAVPVLVAAGWDSRSGQAIEGSATTPATIKVSRDMPRRREDTKRIHAF